MRTAPAAQPRRARRGYPWEHLVRSDRLPHIWCPECGIGAAVSCFTAALTRLKLDPDKVTIVSGIGCSGRVAGYVNLDSFHTTHGRAIPFATGLKMANPALKVVVFSGDGDLVAIGGNHFIHAARRNMDLTVICVNNFNYAMTGGQVGPTTPLTALSTTTPYGNFEHPFNLPGLAASCGAVYVARWTTLHVRRLIRSMEEALSKRGFSFVEVISPCPTLYTRRNKLGTGLDRMREFRARCEVRHGASPQSVEIELGGRITVGTFVDIDKPTLQDTLDRSMKAALGEAYHRIDVTQTVRADRRALRDA
ncbi:MAG: 2-oxoacid:ferredoxin oxidoreductase subunit beta [Acidobacteriota bacterium]